ncbi:MAG: hypothetical protein AB7G23_20890 [Vicinamibacterales bacterium]
MSVLVTATGELQDGKFDDAVKLLQAELPATRARKGCESMDLIDA